MESRQGHVIVSLQNIVKLLTEENQKLKDDLAAATAQIERFKEQYVNFERGLAPKSAVTKKYSEVSHSSIDDDDILRSTKPKSSKKD